VTSSLHQGGRFRIGEDAGRSAHFPNRKRPRLSAANRNRDAGAQRGIGVPARDSSIPPGTRVYAPPATSRSIMNVGDSRGEAGQAARAEKQPRRRVARTLR